MTVKSAARSFKSSSRHALVVDDEPLATSMLGAYLRHKGYRVSTANSGSEAWRLYRADPADLIITDWRMPGGSGDALMGWLGAAGPRVPVIVATGHMEALPPCTPGQHRLVLHKPLDLRQVLTTVERLLEAA